MKKMLLSIFILFSVLAIAAKLFTSHQKVKNIIRLKIVGHCQEAKILWKLIFLKLGIGLLVRFAIRHSAY